MNKASRNIIPLRFCLSGGGTGGHLFPAIAIADNLKEKYPDAEFLFVGASGKMEMKKVPEAGYKIKGLWISGFQRKKILKNILLPFKIISSLLSSFFIIKRFKPHAVIGTGGYASAPILYIASLLKVPTLIQEQNFFPGITNKILGPKVDKICVVFDDMDKFFPREKLITTGNPVRKNLLSGMAGKEKAVASFNLQPGKFTVLVLGGSLGAGSINKGVANSIKIIQEHDAQLIWQTGETDFIDCSNRFKDEKNIRIHSFINKMEDAYAAADLVICRAGAITLAEIALLGKPSILIPSPNVAEDHQTKNALVLLKEQAVEFIPDKEVNERLPEKLNELLTNKSKLEILEENIRKFGKPGATEEIVFSIQRLIKEKWDY